MGRSKKISGRRLVYDQLEARRLLSLVLSPISITATTQAPFDGVVATLVDTVRSDSPSSFTTPPGSVQINWGDGTPATSGQVVGPIYPGVFEVEGSHAYTAADSYTVGISVANQSGYDANATGTATVTSLPPQLIVAAQDVAGTAGTALTDVPVATFLDTNTSDTASQFLALITWGDGNASIGTVQGGKGTFTVTGTNTYAAAGTYSTNVTILDTTNSASAVATGQAVIAPGPTLTATGTTFPVTPGTAPTEPIVVANFTDTNPMYVNNPNPTTLPTAAINWGDGQTTSGTVTQVSSNASGGTFTVSGTHTYSGTSPAGSYPVTVTISDPSGQTVMASGEAVVTSYINATGTVFSATPKVALPADTIVANFTDTNPIYVNNSNPSVLPTAVINWGDGQTSSGTVNFIGPNASGGTFTVTPPAGSHTYTSPAPLGAYPVTVTILDPSGQTGTAVGSAFVTTPAAGTVFIATGTTFTTTPGTGPTQPIIVANVVDTNPNANMSNIVATINWGDGTTTTGVVNLPNPSKPNSYTVTGVHTYSPVSPPGSYTITVTIADPSGQKITASSTALVASFINATGTTFSATPGTPASVTVANFTDSNPDASTSNLMAVVNWGDGQTTAGMVGSTGTPGDYTVTGTHTYASSSAATHAVTVTILDPSGQTATVNSTAVMSPITTLTPVPTTAYFTAGVQPSGSVFVGSFYDTNTSATAGQFTASINWGDGTISAGTVAESSTPGLFLITATHTYATPTPTGQTDPITIAIQDQTGDTTSILSKAVVAPATGTLTPISTTAYFTAGVQPSSPVLVGSFTDTNTAATAGQFTATINWDDGTSSTGTVTESSSTGLFLVTGSHAYLKPGTYTDVAITIEDQAGDSITIKSTAVVSTLAGTLTPIPTTANFTAGVQPSSPVLVGSFTDTNTAATAGQFLASIDWGDGTTTNGTVTASTTQAGLFLVTGVHTYAVPGSHPITITIQDQTAPATASPTTINSTAQVSPAPTTLTANPPITVDFTAGVQPSSPVTLGSFYDSNTAASASQFTASINWGDNTSSAGTVIASPGGLGLFLVTGVHTYAAPPGDTITITVQDQTGHTVGLTATAVVSPAVITLTANPPITNDFTTGVQPSSPVTVGSFYDSNTAATASQFTASISWGDGNTTVGTVTASSSGAGLFLVTGTHLYASANTYMVTIMVQDQLGDTVPNFFGKSVVTTYTANGVASGLTGGLSTSSAFINGPYSALGFTNTNRPTFSGTAPAYSVVQVYARHFHADAQLYLGEAVADGNGNWTLTTGPLAVGTYIVSATDTIPGGYPSTLTPLDGGNRVYIGLAPRFVRRHPHGEKAVTHHPAFRVVYPVVPKTPRMGHKRS
jgi:hypothetical protein